MSRLLVFQHVAAEPLGTLDPLIRRRGHRVRYVNFERHPDHEPNVDRYRGLVVLGGPMNVDEHERRAHLRAEMRAIERMLHQGKPVLGICLGAQLLAHVLGAPVRRNEVPEIGWHQLRLTPQGREDAVLAPLGEQAQVFQWHAYRFDIPSGAVHLASTATCAEQAFRYGENAYGFQFHLEMDQHLIQRWLAHPLYREELHALAGAQAGDPATALLEHTRMHIGTMQAHADQVFNRFLDRIGRPQRRYTLPSREFA
jgi:GMP synthase (glutamine-hydrolysing)